MPKFRKKPITVIAIQYKGGKTTGVCFCDEVPLGGKSHCHTLEGPLNVSVGDWVIKGIKGEFYPCKPDIFKMTYERVNK